jgi:hypothetical protein
MANHCTTPATAGYGDLIAGSAPVCVITVAGDHCRRACVTAGRDPAALGPGFGGGLTAADRAVFMIAKTLAPENGVKPFVIMVAPRRSSVHNGAWPDRIARQVGT